MLNRNFKAGTASRETIRSNCTLVNGFQDSKVLDITVTPSYETYLRTTTVNAGPESASDTPILPTHSSCLCCHE